MKFTVRYHYSVHLCFQEEGGREIIRFEIYLDWKLPRHRHLDGESKLLEMESRYCKWKDMFELSGFPAQFHRNHSRITLGAGKNPRTFPVYSAGSGGNVHWEIIRFRHETEPHVLNSLRNHAHAPGPRAWACDGCVPTRFGRNEWDTEFVNTIWTARRHIREEHLTDFARRTIKADIKRQAIELGITPVQLLAQCSMDLPGLANPQSAIHIPQSAHPV